MQDKRKLPNLTVEQIYIPRLNVLQRRDERHICTGHIHVRNCGNRVLTKSTRAMGDYKYLLMAQLTWSYLFELVIFLWKPVLLGYLSVLGLAGAESPGAEAGAYRWPLSCGSGKESKCYAPYRTQYHALSGLRKPLSYSR